MIKSFLKIIFAVSLSIGSSVAADLCEPYTGAASRYHGTGACAGNNLITVDLSVLKEGTALVYNSTGLFNPINFGKNWNFSEMAYVVNQAGRPRFVDANYTEISLVQDNNSQTLVAEDRSRTTDTFNVKSDKTWQYASDGTIYTYQLNYGVVQFLSRIVNRFNEVTVVNIGSSNAGKGEYVRYPDGSMINILRSGRTVTFTTSKDAKVKIVLTKDAANRIISIAVNSKDGQVLHAFQYKGATPLVSKHSVTTEGESIYTDFKYDSAGNLLKAERENQSAYKYVRDLTRRFAYTITSDGQVLREGFDRNKRIISSIRYVYGNEDKPYYEQYYSYDSRGRLSEVREGDGRKAKYLYSPSAEYKMPVGKEIWEGAKLVYSEASNMSPNYWLENARTVKNEKGQVVESFRVTYTKSYPFLIQKAENLVSGEMQIYAYSGDQTIANYYNRNKTLFQTDKYTKQALAESANYLDGTTTAYAYYPNGLTQSVTRDGKVVEYKYDSEDRVVYEKSQSGVINEYAYDAQGQVSYTKVTYPAGVVEEHNFIRQYQADGKTLSSLEESVKYPSGKEVRLTKFDAEGNVEERYLNGVGL